jgi:hypothetical protein
MQRALISLLLLLSASAPCRAAEQGVVSVDVWCELEPMIQESSDYPLSDDEARQRILEEARGLLSMMIYGARFSYTPADSARQMDEQFQISPVAEIQWGDPALRITDAYLQEGVLHAKIEYSLRDFQEARRRAWGSAAVPAATGAGECSVFAGPSPEDKRLSLQEALKDAIRNHLRPIHFNKPREVTGELLIWEKPRVLIQAGAYVTEVDVKLQVREYRPYSLF